MIGNWKNIDSVEKVLIKETKKEGLKTYLDSLKIHMDISIGELSETSLQCPRQWLLVLFSSGLWLSSK